MHVNLPETLNGDIDTHTSWHCLAQEVDHVSTATSWAVRYQCLLVLLLHGTGSELVGYTRLMVMPNIIKCTH